MINCNFATLDYGLLDMKSGNNIHELATESVSIKNITGLENVTEGNITYTIYNLNGVCLKRDGSIEDIRALAPGIYIINGKKLLVR